jgi:hypothetical protein
VLTEGLIPPLGGAVPTKIIGFLRHDWFRSLVIAAVIWMTGVGHAVERDRTVVLDIRRIIIVFFVFFALTISLRTIWFVLASKSVVNLEGIHDTYSAFITRTRLLDFRIKRDG